MEDRRPLYQAHWDTNDPDYKDGDGIGAESVRDLAQRVNNFQNRLLDTNFSNAYIFCHGFFLRAFMLRHIWGTTRPMIKTPQVFHEAARAWHYPNCGTVHGQITEDGKVLLGNISIAHVPSEIRS